MKSQGTTEPPLLPVIHWARRSGNFWVRGEVTGHCRTSPRWSNSNALITTWNFSIHCFTTVNYPIYNIIDLVPTCALLATQNGVLSKASFVANLWPQFHKSASFPGGISHREMALPSIPSSIPHSHLCSFMTTSFSQANCCSRQPEVLKMWLRS